ncbi:hypothetical protein NYQ10_11995 [Flavobacterium johnsoniae]|uniref:hypothetical protein n=1 Tax=Flavobacterium johnsoniae TaxID=986 RepID=UPI0025B2599C|nr:hypothetical protein [Flavobacterium johnsoniae]WJS92807.1 hypothetical protein NYQ10_11995 [Flavobacterium johnsoniae]
MKIENLTEDTAAKSNKKKKIIIFIFLLLVIISVLGYVSYVHGKPTTSSYERDKPRIFTISEYDKISESFKKVIHQLFLQNDYLTDGTYFFTKIPSRANKVIAYGNFSNKKQYNGVAQAYDEGYINDDIAVVLEKNDFRSSAIFLLSENGDVLYYKEFEDELPTIKSFKKGAKIFMDSAVLQKAPSDGILIFTKNEKRVLIYVPEKNIFEIFYQYTNEDLKNREIDMDDDYEEEDIDSVKTANKFREPLNIVNDSLEKK